MSIVFCLTISFNDTTPKNLFWLAHIYIKSVDFYFFVLKIVFAFYHFTINKTLEIIETLVGEGFNVRKFYDLRQRNLTKTVIKVCNPLYFKDFNISEATAITEKMWFRQKYTKISSMFMYLCFSILTHQELSRVFRFLWIVVIFD